MASGGWFQVRGHRDGNPNVERSLQLFLHHGMHLTQKAIGGKANGDRVQELTGMMSAVIERQLNGQLMEFSKRAELMSAKVQSASERDTQEQLEHVKGGVIQQMRERARERASETHDSAQGSQASTERCQKNLEGMTRFIAELQVDSQIRVKVP